MSTRMPDLTKTRTSPPVYVSRLFEGTSLTGVTLVASVLCLPYVIGIIGYVCRMGVLCVMAEL